MSTRILTIEHNGNTYHGETGTIIETTLGIQTHGILTAMLDIEGQSSWSVMAGGYQLEGASGFGTAQIRAILQTMKVDSWEKLHGASVIAVFDPDSDICVGIAHPIAGDPLIFAEHADTHRAKHDNA